MKATLPDDLAIVDLPPQARLRLIVPASPVARANDDPLPALRQAGGLGRAPSSAGKVPCSDCNLREHCLPVGLAEDEIERIDSRLVAVLRKVAHRETLFRAGSRFDAMFQIRTGFFKTVVTTRQGREQVTGFQIGGDLIGFDGIDTGLHSVEAIALEDSQVCVIPYGTFEALGHEMPPLQRHWNQLMSREIVNDHSAMLRLGSMNADERVAAFLLDLTDRLRRRGFSASSIVLRMGREEIGSYLGLKLETVSRTFSKLQANGLLFVRQRQIQITDRAGLEHLLDGVIA